MSILLKFIYKTGGSKKKIGRGGDSGGGKYIPRGVERETGQKVKFLDNVGNKFLEVLIKDFNVFN